MGLQLIFVVETNSRCKSDWIYIKETIDFFCTYDRGHTKFSPIYMDGKDKYKNKEKEISKLVSQYCSQNKINQTKVIFCFDCDNYDSKPEDLQFLKDVKLYCKNKGYDLVWFCKDIERVYLNKKVDDSKKKDEAARFMKKRIIKNVDKGVLSVDNYRANSSNIMNILEKYLKLK